MNNLEIVTVTQITSDHPMMIAIKSTGLSLSKRIAVGFVLKQIANPIIPHTECFGFFCHAPSQKHEMILFAGYTIRLVVIAQCAGAVHPWIFTTMPHLLS